MIFSWGPAVCREMESLMMKKMHQIYCIYSMNTTAYLSTICSSLISFPLSINPSIKCSVVNLRCALCSPRCSVTSSAYTRVSGGSSSLVSTLIHGATPRPSQRKTLHPPRPAGDAWYHRSAHISIYCILYQMKYLTSQFKTNTLMFILIILLHFLLFFHLFLAFLRILPYLFISRWFISFSFWQLWFLMFPLMALLVLLSFMYYIPCFLLLVCLYVASLLRAKYTN